MVLGFRIPSTSMVNVFNSSNVKRESPMTRLKWCLKSFIVDSHSPPKWGATGGIKCQEIRCSLEYLFSCVLRN